jgi:hypothetical protein
VTLLAVTSQHLLAWNDWRNHENIGKCSRFSGQISNREPSRGKSEELPHDPVFSVAITLINK